MNLVLTRNEMAKLGEVLEKEILSAGADHVMIVDMAGNLILDRGFREVQDIFSLAALSAANFAATAEIARLIGEEDFTLLFHKGGKRNIHFSRLGNEYIIITLFGEEVSLGLIRLKVTRALEKLLEIFDTKGGAECGLHRSQQK
jgi:predicted regulator of Ras-like GTPase activity (Roadblock/LC7/MglB family)